MSDYEWSRRAPVDRAAIGSTAPSAAPLSARHAAVLDLQRAAGNRAVGNLINRGASSVEQVYASTVSVPLSATIRRTVRDAEPGAETTDEIDPNAVTEALLGAAPEVAEPEDGQTVSLPDMIMSGGTGFQSDTIGGAVAYSGTITRTGVVNAFGATSPYTFNLTRITVTPSPGTYTVAATLENPITFNVTSGGNTDVPSETAAALTAANYATAASDLTPDMGDLGGRPPRTRFWAEDLTVRHEHFHADEDKHFAATGTTTAQSWLLTQAASRVAEVQALLAQIPGKVINFVDAAMAYPAREERAYADGAPLYRARAGAIKAKGDRGEYH